MRAKSRDKKRAKRFAAIYQQIRRPVAGPLIVVYFLSGLAMAQMEAMLIPYMADKFKWGLKLTTYGFAYIGVIMLVTQGYLIRKWMPKFGEPKILVVGLVLFTISLFGIGSASLITFVALSMTLLALGNGMMRPPNLGIISLVTPADEQGLSMGVTNSLASLGRIIGPALGGFLYENINSSAPFMGAGVVAFMALALTALNYRNLPALGASKSQASH